MRQYITMQLGAGAIDLQTVILRRAHTSALRAALQVYKGKLKDGTPVAVKVQRPHVVETVSVDLFIIRCCCALSCCTPRSSCKCSKFQGAQIWMLTSQCHNIVHDRAHACCNLQSVHFDVH